MRLVMPWPDRITHPNARPHRMDLARAKAAQRLEWAALARQQGAFAVESRALHIRLTGQAPDRRARDVDGLLSSCKAGLDGLAAVLGVDDSKWTFTLPPLKIDPAKRGAVVLEIRTELTA